MFCRYGDKAPKTIVGKMLGVVWMLAGLIIITMFIGIVTTALTSVSLEGRNNLRGVKVRMISATRCNRHYSISFI